MKKFFTDVLTGALVIAFVVGLGFSSQATAPKSIVETAIGAGSFQTLVEAVKSSGLVETLSSPGPFTVFAPTDEAFAKLPKGTVEALLKDIPKLKSILTYHVVAGKVMVNNANVVKTDILCSNPSSSTFPPH